MTNTDSYTAAPPHIPERKGWPISVWIVPDVLFGFVLTLIASVIILGISIGLQAASGQIVFDPNGVVRLASGEILFGAGNNNEALQKLITTPGVFFGSILAQNLAFALVVWLRVRVLRKLPWSWLGVQARRFGRLAGLGVGLGVVFLVLNVVSGYIFSQLLGIEQNQADQFPIHQGDVLGQALIVLSAIVLAPLGEELLFRGYIFHAIRQDLGRVAAYLLSAGAFSVVHIFGVTQGAPALLIPLFFGGLLLAWAVDTTESLIPSIIAHAINNGVAMAVLVGCINTPGGCRGI